MYYRHERWMSSRRSMKTGLDEGKLNPYAILFHDFVYFVIIICMLCFCKSFYFVNWELIGQNRSPFVPTVISTDFYDYSDHSRMCVIYLYFCGEIMILITSIRAIGLLVYMINRLYEILFCVVIIIMDINSTKDFLLCLCLPCLFSREGAINAAFFLNPKFAA